jgi:hypothetical protein
MEMTNECVRCCMPVKWVFECKGLQCLLETIFDRGYSQSPWDSLLMDMHDLDHAHEGAKSCINMI